MMRGIDLVWRSWRDFGERRLVRLEEGIIIIMDSLVEIMGMGIGMGLQLININNMNMASNISQEIEMKRCRGLTRQEYLHFS